MATTDLIPFDVGSTVLIWNQAARSAIATRGPEGSMAFLKQGNGSYNDIWSGEVTDTGIVGGLTCNGTLASPAANSSAGWQLGSKPGTLSYAGAGPVLVNPNDGSLLMCLHAEQWAGGHAPDYWSYVVLARSTDNGVSWTYVGIILKPQFPFDNTQHTNTGYDVGNGTLLLFGSYVYCYFREIPTATPTTNNPISVARCLASDLFSSSITGTVGTWKKFDGSGFTGDPFTGLGSPIFTFDGSFPPFWPSASLDSQTGTVYLAIETNPLTNNIQIYMYESKNGLIFTPKTLITNCTASGSSGAVYPSHRSIGYTTEYSGNGTLHIFSPEVTSPWTNAIVNRYPVNPRTGSRRNRTNGFRGGPAGKVMR